MVRDPRGAVSRAARWWFAPLPPPPERLRRGPLRPGAFPSPLRSARLTSLLGIALGVAFAVCFATGLLSHLIQHPPGWFRWPARPVGLYRVTQGVHVATGLACVPLLGVKLWSVYPRLFAWPPVRSLAHAAERAGVALLVAAALFQVISGVLNVAHWYTPMPFFFTTGHYRVAWLVAGALLLHIGVQLPVVREALRRTRRLPDVGRRRLLTAAGAAAGLITLTTVGQTLRPLESLAVLAPRRPSRGPQGLPVNKTAAAAGTTTVSAATYRLSLTGPRGTIELDLNALNALPQHTVDLPITCVEGWSAGATWTGVRLADLVERAGADPGRATVLVESLEAGGRYRSSTVDAAHTRDSLTLIALRLNGQVLDPDHGFPARLIAPNRPGVLQTKWVGRLTVRGEE
ncbi:MAG: molybdopterin-dependent oxidoreductase [Actinomycetota bacterium]|nr:molybdopterin-dependent oxidoreductase [Actinomycetota bacterium]